MFALIVRISSNYLRLSPFIWVCNLSRIINYYDQKEALIIHLVNILIKLMVYSLIETKTCYVLPGSPKPHIKKKACKYGVKNARGEGSFEGTPFNRGALCLFIPLEPS